MRSNCAIYVEPLEARACLDGSASSLLASLDPCTGPELQLTPGWCSLKGECFSYGKALVKPRPGVEASVKRCPAKVQRSGFCGSLYGCWSDGSTTLNRRYAASTPSDFACVTSSSSSLICSSRSSAWVSLTRSSCSWTCSKLSIENLNQPRS
jgi:hypothetical protein